MSFTSPTSDTSTEGKQDPELTAKVVLHNNDHSLFDDVVATLKNRLTVTEDEADKLATEAHQNGKATVFTGSTADCNEMKVRLSSGNFLKFEVES